MAELVLSGKRYTSSGRLDVFTQLHVARKLGPAMPVVEGIVDRANDNKDKSVLTVLLLSQIPDQDVEFVIRKCLAVVTRQTEGEPPARLQSASGVLMFDDVELADLLKLTVMVIEENLGDFFRTALASMAALADPK